MGKPNFKMTLAGTLMAAFLVTGCAGGDVSPRAQLAASCQGYASTLANLSFYKEDLSENQVASVDTIRQTVGPICADVSNVDDAEGTLRSVRDQLRQLRQIERDVQ